MRCVAGVDNGLLLAPISEKRAEQCSCGQTHYTECRNVDMLSSLGQLRACTLNGVELKKLMLVVGFSWSEFLNLRFHTIAGLIVLFGPQAGYAGDHNSHCQRKLVMLNGYGQQNYKMILYLNHHKLATPTSLTILVNEVSLNNLLLNSDTQKQILAYESPKVKTYKQ